MLPTALLQAAIRLSSSSQVALFRRQLRRSVLRIFDHHIRHVSTAAGIRREDRTQYVASVEIYRTLVMKRFAIWTGDVRRG